MQTALAGECRRAALDHATIARTRGPWRLSAAAAQLPPRRALPTARPADARSALLESLCPADRRTAGIPCCQATLLVRKGARCRREYCRFPTGSGPPRRLSGLRLNRQLPVLSSREHSKGAAAALGRFASTPQPKAAATARRRFDEGRVRASAPASPPQSTPRQRGRKDCDRRSCIHHRFAGPSPSEPQCSAPPCSRSPRRLSEGHPNGGCRLDACLQADLPAHWRPPPRLLRRRPGECARRARCPPPPTAQPRCTVDSRRFFPEDQGQRLRSFSRTSPE